MSGADRKFTAIRHQYEELGVEDFYAQFGASYHNPHEPIIRRVIAEAVTRGKLDLSCVLDLACGSGEVTSILNELGAKSVDGIDPYTGEAYLKRIGRPAEALNFEQIAGGALDGRAYSLIVCSFALHLIENSRLPGLLTRLSAISHRLLILTPHKRPHLKPDWGWQLEDEFIIDRVRARLYLKR